MLRRHSIALTECYHETACSMEGVIHIRQARCTSHTTREGDTDSDVVEAQLRYEVEGHSTAQFHPSRMANITGNGQLP
jgi:hypothetical protein